LIHQFTGALIDNGYKKGVFLTSGSFRKGCFTVIKSIHEKSKIEIDLVDGKRFLEFLKLFNSTKINTLIKCQHWHNHGYWREMKDAGQLNITAFPPFRAIESRGYSLEIIIHDLFLYLPDASE